MAPERLRALARALPGTPLAGELETGATALAAATAPPARFAEASRWLVRLRREAPSTRDRAAALALFEASVALEETAYASGAFHDAKALFADLVFRDEFEEFLTLPAYERLA